MYRGFNLKVLSSEINDSFLKAGEKLFVDQKKIIDKGIDAYLNPNGSLSAAKMVNDWFPELQFNVFISHSHQDELLAKKLAGYLYETFNIVPFIDSCVWGSSDELLAKIDKAYCFNGETNSYSYEKRNRSTSHVHMMLSVALLKMLDKTEAVFFLNTPSSITAKESISEAASTGSPWIYSELAATQLIRIRSRHEHRGLIKRAVNDALAKSDDLSVEYDVDLKHLSVLDAQKLVVWRARMYNHQKLGTTALDQLYALVPPTKKANPLANQYLGS